MQPSFYAPFHSPFGACSIVWQENTQGPRVRHVFLPSEKIRMKKMKRTLLEQEGLEFSASGKVLLKKVYY